MKPIVIGKNWKFRRTRKALAPALSMSLVLGHVVDGTALYLPPQPFLALRASRHILPSGFPRIRPDRFSAGPGQRRAGCGQWAELKDSSKACPKR